MKTGKDEAGRPFFDLSNDEVAQLAAVGLYMMFFTRRPVPCGPSHHFCEAGTELPDKTLRTMFMDSGVTKAEARAKAARMRDLFEDFSVCSDGSFPELRTDELAEWINCALNETIFADDAIQTLHGLASAIGAKVKLDA